MAGEMKTVGQALVEILEANGVDTIFGIPGVHTVELYHGLAGSTIRHITPRHEQGAGFMADGYARVSGKPGVCMVITGPGLTNTITAMAQAYQDSVPMLVISGVNARATLGKGRGQLHELPDQRAMMATLALMSHTLLDPTDLPWVMERAFLLLRTGRRGPVHIEIPIDVMGLPIVLGPVANPIISGPRCDISSLLDIAIKCQEAKRAVILCGGGAITAAPGIEILAERLDAPIVTTVNARGLFYGHPLSVPASPSLEPVRRLLAESDLVLALGTQMGQTDYDIHNDNGFPALENLVRVDIDATQLTRGPAAQVSVHSTVNNLVDDLLSEIGGAKAKHSGAERAEATRRAARAELDAKMRCEIDILETIRDTLPGCIIVGDSTQAVYSGNLYYDAGRIRGWFNAATGYGALGYGPPAAIGASLADPSVSVVCLTGDGGMQFSLAEIGSARDAGAKVIFLVWNNDGYEEIKNYMSERAIEPVGVTPTPPDFLKIADAYGLPAVRLEAISQLPEALLAASETDGPSLIEIHQRKTRGATA